MKLSEFPGRARAAAAQVKDGQALLTRLTLIFEGPIKRHVRVRTGALRNSVHGRVSPNQGAVGTNMSYAQPVNARFPFIEPGLQDGLPQARQAVADFGIKIIQTISRG